MCGGDNDEGDASGSGNGDSAEKNVPFANSLRTVHRVTADFSVPPSPGLALRTVLTAADLLRARACAIVSPGTTNLTPDWIANLLTPVFREKFDFVAPLYTRHKVSRIAGPKSALSDEPRTLCAAESANSTRMNGDFPAAWPQLASIRMCGTKSPFGPDRKHGWQSPQFHPIFAAASHFSVRNYNPRQAPGRTL